MITLKIADQKRSDFYVVRTMSLCALGLILSGPAFSVICQARGGAQRPGCQKARLTSTD